MSELDKRRAAIIEKEEFSTQDAENIVKGALGEDALERPDDEDLEIAEKKQKSAGNLPKDLRTILWQIENENAQSEFQKGRIRDRLKSAGNLSNRGKRRLNEAINYLNHYGDISEKVQEIIAQEKNKDKALESINDLIKKYESLKSKKNLSKEVGDDLNDGDFQKNLLEIKTDLEILNNLKNRITKINNFEKLNFMSEPTPKELSSIISVQKNKAGEEAGWIADEDLARDMVDEEKRIYEEYKKEFPDVSDEEVIETSKPAMSSAAEAVFKEATGMEYEAAAEKARENLRNEEAEIDKEISNNSEKVKDQASGIANEEVKSDIIGGADKAAEDLKNIAADSKKDAEDKISGIEIEAPKSEPKKEEAKEVKDEKIEAAKKDIENKIKFADAKIKILENPHGNPYDRRMYIAREAGIDIKQLTPKEEGRQRLIVLARRKAEKAGLQKVEEIANDPEIKNYDELQDRLWDNYKATKAEFGKKCDELGKEPKDSDRRKKLIEEKRDLQAKMQMARDSMPAAEFDSRALKEKEAKDKKRQMKNQKAAKSEPVIKPQEPKAVEPKIDAKPADVQPDSQPNRNERDEIAAAYDQRIENLRLGVKEAKDSGKNDEVARLEKFVRELENEKKWRLKQILKKDHAKKADKKEELKEKELTEEDIKHINAQWELGKSTLKNLQDVLSKEKDDERKKELRYQIEYVKKSIKETLENIVEKAGVRVAKEELVKGEAILKKYDKQREELIKAGVADSLMTPEEKQEYYDAQSQKNHFIDVLTSKGFSREVAKDVYNQFVFDNLEENEKTPEEILREKNIEVYGGAEKLNQIFEDYKRLNELEDRGAYDDRSPLFPEWDALRVKIANINLEIIAKDRTADLYKIQNKDEVIREYFNTKLSESFEAFQKDIEKASPNELAIRAATLIKYRNELKNCEWQGKDKYRDIPKKEYIEIIKELEQKIEILNGMLPKKEDALPEAALKDMSIDDFKKIEKEPEYKGGLPAVIEGGLKTELTKEQSAKVEGILKDFGMTAEDAEKIEGFRDLSYGQRLLALENLRQLTLRDVRIGAVEKQKQEADETQGFWKRMWKGIKKKYDIAKHEKSIANDLSKEDYAATLAQLSRGMKEFKTDVKEINGRLEFQYVSGLENLTPEQTAQVQRFNEVASELSKLPMEWTADNSKKGFFRQMMDKAGLGQAWSPDDPTRSQHNRTGALSAEFQTLKQEVIQILKQQKDADLKKGGVEKFDDLETQSGAVAQMLQIENLLRYNRAMNVNPDAEKALLEIKSAPLWKRALNNIATERGIYFAAGFALRSASVTVLGTAGIVGGAAGMGGYMGYKRGKEFLRENDALAQHKDFEETKKKRIEKFARAKQGKAESAGGTEKLEKRIEDANVLARNLENFVEYIEEEDDPKRQMDLSRRLRDRVKFVKDALDQGRINFGATGERAASLYELTDKLNDAVNCVEIYHPSTRHEADQWSEAHQSKVMEKLNQYLAESKIELDAERRKYLVKQLAKGAMYGAGFASAGMIARELFSHLDPHIFNAQGETDIGVRWISGSGSGKPLVGGIVGKYIHGEPGGGGGGHIPPHEGGVPAGGDGSGKSAYEAFMGNKPKDYDIFPWQKSTESVQEIPIGQGSFAERFLRAVGMHEGSPARPDLQKIIAEYSEYFKHHPELIKTQGAGNKSALEFFSHMKSDLQNAGLDGRAADETVKNFSSEMGKVGTGFYPEGESLPGIETTGSGVGAGAGGSTAEQAAAAVGAKQDILNSAVETASGKMNSVWKMAEHQLDQKGFFKDLSGTADEIAAKKTYLIDAIKDKVAENPHAFGLKDVDELAVGQKIDFSKIFENESALKQLLLAKADKLSPQEIASILTHNKNIADFHHLHPDVHITSENVDQIAAGHGDALLKKVAEQAVEQAPTAPKVPIEGHSTPGIDERIKDLKESGVSSDDLGKLTVKDIKDLTNEQVAQIKDYTAKVEALKKIGISENDIKSLTEKDIRDLTPEQIRNLASDKAMPAHEPAQKLEIDKEFFKEKPATEEILKGSEVIAAAKPIHVSHDNFSADIKFAYDKAGNPVSLESFDGHISGASGTEYYKSDYLKSIYEWVKQTHTDEALHRRSVEQHGRLLTQYIKAYDELNYQGEKQEANVLLDFIKTKIIELNKRFGQDIINSEKLPQEIREKLGK